MSRENPKILPVLLFFTVLLCGYCPAARIYVDGNVSGGDGTGTSWENALVYLQDALAAPQSGDEIYVAAGIYYPDRSTAVPGGSGDPNAAFDLVDGVVLRGGYAGAADPNARDFSAFESVLCGDLAGDDVGRTNTGENSFHVVTVDVNDITILEGFTITGGNANGATLETMHGGGIYNSGGDATIINCRLTGNQAEQGGGMYNNSSSPRVVNCYIMSNWAYDSGGGVYDDLSDANFINCLFSGNQAEGSDGGGVFHDGGEAAFNNCTFSGNWASVGGSGIYAEAGIVKINNCIIREEISLNGGSVVVARYSNLLGGLGDEGNIDANSLFVDADGADDVFGTMDDNVRLTVDSPCVNAGDPNRMTDLNETDLDGEQRINYYAVDMGAYEFFVVPALVGHWKLDEDVGSTAYDSVGANDGSLEGDPVWMPGDGQIDGALAFDGDGDYVNCGASRVFDIRNEITVSAWIRIYELTDSWRPIVTKGDTGWRLQAGSFDSDPGTLQFAGTGLWTPNTQFGDITGTIRVDDGLWHHAAGVYNGAQISLYIDGVLDVTSVASGQIDLNGYDVLIGGNAQEPDRFFNGDIDDARVYNYALSAEDIAALANPSTVFHVDGVNGDNSNDGRSRETAFEHIQTGVSATTADGDTVLVWPGVYNEEVVFLGKAITVRSAADAAVVWTPTGYAFTFLSGDPNSVLSNFIIRDSPGAIFCNATSPTIRNMTIVNNEFGIEAYVGAEPDISNCIFWNNTLGNTDEYCQSHHSWDWEPVEAAAHWKFDEGVDLHADDSVGFSDGTVYGPVWIEGQDAKWSLDFDGNDDYVFVPSSLAINVGAVDYTLSAWIKPELTSYIHVIMSKITGQQDKEYMLSIDRDRIRLDVEKDGNAGRAYSVEVVTLNTWQHVAVTFDASTPPPTVTFYYNGLPVDPGASADPITLEPNSLGANLYIGMRGGAAYDDREFIGAIDDVMIFDRDLSAEEMHVVYKSQLSPLFADPENNDYHLLSEKGRFVPTDPNANNGLEGLWAFDAATSPCVDSGAPSETPWGERMPNGGRVNLGAYGNTLYASMSRWPIEGDINRDGVVDLADLAIMGWEWLIALPWAAGG